LASYHGSIAELRINGPSSGVNLDAGEAIHITTTGSITDAGDDGVENGPGDTTFGDGVNTGILNEGSIDAGDNGVLLSTRSTLQGSIVNQGTIAAGADGIQLDETSAVTGDISNAGSIGSAGTPVGDVGISVFSNSSVGGDITNSGDIHSTNDGIEVTDGSEVTGAIRNESGGTISAGQEGIELSGATVQQGIVNAGSITAAEDGILIDSAATLNGGIDTSGTISAQGGDGIRIDQASTVSGGISNSGSITASGGTVDEPSDGIEVSGLSTTVTGNIVNSGSINAETDGIDISQSASVQGDVRNAEDGVITAGESGIEIDAAATVTGNVSKAGEIDSDDGVQINNAEVQGSISNTGTIDADEDGIVIYGTGTQVQQGVSNSGTLTGGLAIYGTDGAGGGIDVLNTGEIDLGSSTSFISGDFTQLSAGELALELLNPFGAGVAALTIAGDAILDGLLSLTFDTGFSVADGERFTLFGINGTLSGMFANYADDALVSTFSGVGLYLDYTDSGNVDLYGAAAPLPGTLALIGLGAFGLVGAGAGRRRQRD
jgi:hypothetical protein